MARWLASALRPHCSLWEGLAFLLLFGLAPPSVRAEDEQEASAVDSASTPELDAQPLSEQHALIPERSPGRRSSTRGGGDAVAARRGWNRVDPADLALHEGHARPPLVIHTDGKSDTWVIDAQTDTGGFDVAASAQASAAFGAYKGGPALHPRLLDLIYRATRHFSAPSIVVVSGIRRDRQASRHSHGMAADIVLAGVMNEDLAAYFRGQGFTGVGTYPRAGFVHVDVRAESYFWVDRSPPNKRWKDIPVRGEGARAADAAALTRGELPTPDPPRLRKALSRRAATAAQVPAPTPSATPVGQPPDQTAAVGQTTATPSRP